jgi:hypothetical protein
VRGGKGGGEWECRDALGWIPVTDSEKERLWHEVPVVVELVCRKHQVSTDMEGHLSKAAAAVCGADARRVRVANVTEHRRQVRQSSSRALTEHTVHVTLSVPLPKPAADKLMCAGASTFASFRCQAE